MRKLLAVLLVVLTLACSQAASVPKSVTAAIQPQTDTAKNNIKVWVNTASNVYHCPGTRWYGITKHGIYMTQKEAKEKGNRPAYGRECEP